MMERIIELLSARMICVLGLANLIYCRLYVRVQLGISPHHIAVITSAGTAVGTYRSLEFEPCPAPVSAVAGIP
jgi:hypothetical protein